MSKAEMLRQAAEAQNQKRLETLAGQAETLRERSSSVEDLSAALIPLTQALATVSEETGKTLVAIDQKSRQTSERFDQQLSSVLKELRTATAQAREAAIGLTLASSRIETRFLLWTVGTATLTGLLVAVFVTLMWIRWSPPTISVELDAKVVAEQLKGAGVLQKPSKGK